VEHSADVVSFAETGLTRKLCIFAFESVGVFTSPRETWWSWGTESVHCSFHHTRAALIEVAGTSTCSSGAKKFQWNHPAKHMDEPLSEKPHLSLGKIS